MTFDEKYRAASSQAESRVCVGLDPDIQKLPTQLSRDVAGVVEFLKGVIDSTHDLACVYKPNFAFFGALGAEGYQALEETISHIPENVPVILDFKAGDIGNTAEKYAEMAYDVFGVDAVTVNPLMGYDAVSPFQRDDKCVFLLCLTSNPGSADFQRQETQAEPLFETIAKTASEWSSNGQCGLVVGATHPDDLPRVRQLAPDLPFLIPGVGSQGGEAESIVSQAATADGVGVLVNASRSILYASSGTDFAEASREATDQLRRALNGESTA